MSLTFSFFVIVFSIVLISVIVTFEIKSGNKIVLDKLNMELELKLENEARIKSIEKEAKLKELQNIKELTNKIQKLQLVEEFLIKPFVSQYSNNVHFITYGDHLFEKSKELIMNEAIESNFFNTVKSYSPQDLTESFSLEFKDVLSQKRGGGYWIWKFDIILQRLKEIPNHDILVYADAGCAINKHGYLLYEQYIKDLQQDDNFMISFQMSFIEEHWTCREMFKLFQIPPDSKIRKSGQYMGGILIMKNCQQTIEIFEQCIFILKSDQKVATDYYNDNNQESTFIENRHDQSILSIARKMRNTVVYKDETHFADFESEIAKKHPFLATRRKLS